MYKKISDYGIIGNFNTVALVGNDGSIDWLCLPHIDSPSVFGALLDDHKGGRFSISPAAEYDSTAEYVAGTNILTTTFRVRSGVMRLTDFMPVSELAEEEVERESCSIYRLLEVLQGEMEINVVFAPRFDYARAQAKLRPGENAILAEGGGEGLVLSSTREGLMIGGDRAEARWRLKEGEDIWLNLRGGSAGPYELDREAAERALNETAAYWNEWRKRNETGRDLDVGHFKGLIDRSALVLKLLEFKSTGAIAAAATTSLPEEVGGARNWDYRFSWIRDSALTIEALFNVGHLSEMEAYLRWLERIISQCGSEPQILYGLRGEMEIREEELSHLEGYKGSSPVRTGNEAYQQNQLDIYGEIMDAALKLSNYVGKIDIKIWPFLRDLCDTVANRWREKDYGIWEVRGGPYHFVYSKIMCWVALDRGITIASRYGFPADIKYWESLKKEIREEVLSKGWNKEKRAFVQHYGTDALDASNLLIPFYGFLPYDDPRMVSTVDAIGKELVDQDLVYRYRSEDGLPGTEGTFLVCTFWLVDNLIGQRKFEEARSLLCRLERTANHLGLFSEEYDVRWKESLGNFPQAFTHIGFINSVVTLYKEKEELRKTHPRKSLSTKVRQRLLVTRTFLLNQGAPHETTTSEEISEDLKRLMNILRGAYFRTAEGRIAYEEMADSRIYREYGECSRHLQHFDLGLLQTREQRLAFWINLFNVLVIHGVIALGIRDSVREVPRFFRRIQYLVNGMIFSADDIEHGVLRGNHRLPHSVFSPFKGGDPRLRFALEEPDPRIHFALVCASSSCPPIEIYTAKNLDEELEISGRTFLNAGGIQIDRTRGEVRLSSVFRWYGDDFGKTNEERLCFVAPYLYDEENRRFLEQHAQELRIRYQPYDWRLNRT